MESSNEQNDQKNPLQSSEDWGKMYHEFLDFRRNNPTGMPPTKISGRPSLLYYWVQKQRDNKDYLSPVRIAKLNAAQFVWASRYVDPNWEQWYLAFIDFRKSHPTGMPKSEINKKSNPLFVWCRFQRRHIDIMDDSQKARLNAVGFEWETTMRMFEEGWENNFQKFVEFKAANPDSMPHYELNGEFNPLYGWCNSQRLLKRRIGHDKRERLKQAGFDWDKLEVLSSWDRRYMEFVSWRKKNPEGMPQRIIDGQPKSLQEWCIKQINRKKQKKLTAAQIKQLDDVGFFWESKNLDSAWEKKYQEYLEFKRMNPGSQIPPYKDGKSNPLFSWFAKQRELKYRLSPERISKLNVAGFDWNINHVKPDVAWEKRFDQFLEFKRENPNCMPPLDKTDKAMKTLYYWCLKQKIQKHNLVGNRIKRLDEAGFKWDRLDFKETWEQHYKEYADFIKNNPGKKPSLSGTALEVVLNRWCKRQNDGKNRLTPEQINKLDDIGFTWSTKSSKADKIWDKWFEQYLQYRKDNPNAMPPETVNGKRNPVYSWCIKQCQGKHELTKEQIELLDTAGFVWMTKIKHEKWEEMYRKFKEFKEKNPEGTPIPILREQTDSLYEWCRTQRNKKSWLSPEQIQKLDALGFTWKAKNPDETWEQHYQEYLEFRETNAKGMPTAFRNGKASQLHNWCRVQQRFKHKLSPERIKKLNDAGFDWFVMYPDWKDYYNDFLEFRKLSDKGMPDTDYQFSKKNLFKWCHEQRDSKELLPPEYIQKLNEAGFEWE